MVASDAVQTAWSNEASVEPMDIDRQILRKQVSFKDLDHGCAEFVQYPLPAQPTSVCTCWSGLMASMRPSPGSASRHRTRALQTQSNLGPRKEGLLWKLNSDAGLQLSDLADLGNWRRRKFVLGQSSGSQRVPAMFYLSEKANLEKRLACILGESSRYQVLSPVRLESLSTEATMKIRNSTHFYDLAIGQAPKKSAVCDEIAPTHLFPLVLQCKNERMRQHILIVATPSEAARKDWVDAIERTAQAAQYPIPRQNIHVTKAKLRRVYAASKK